MIIAWVGKVMYQLDLTDELSQVHNTLHVSQLWKCLANESVVIPWDDILVDERLNYVWRPIEILERKIEKSCNKEVNLVKVQWQHQKGSESTWQPETEMMEHYLDLFEV